MQITRRSFTWSTSRPLTQRAEARHGWTRVSALGAIGGLHWQRMMGLNGGKLLRADLSIAIEIKVAEGSGIAQAPAG